MMKNNPNRLVSALTPEPLVRKAYLGSLVVSLLMALVIALLWRYLPSEVPLYFSRPWGEARLAPRSYLFLLPGVGIGVILVDIGAARTVRKIDSILVKSLAIGSIVTALMLVLALFGIMRSIL